MSRGRRWRDCGARRGRDAQPLPQGWAAPFLFLFGRNDSTISYMGANIYPQDVENGLYQDDPLAAPIESFCLSWRSTRPGGAPGRARPAPPGRAAGPAGVAERLPARPGRYLAAVSRDFAESLPEDPTAADMRICSTSTAPARSPAPARRSRTSTWCGG